LAGTDPGWVYQGYWIGQKAQSIKNGAGDNVDVLRNPRITILAWANQFIYTSPYKVAGGALGVSTIISIVDLHARSDLFPPPFPPGKMLTASGAGIGDIVFGPFLQFNPVLGPDGAPIFDQRVEFDLIVPTGTSAVPT
jgi:hypothetical protein